MSSTTGLARALVRRWYVTLAGLILTGLICITALSIFPVSYQAKSAVLLVPPVTKVGENPYLNLGSLGGMADVLTQALTDNAAATELRRAGLSDSYTVTVDPASNAPILVITAKGKTQASAIATAKRIVSMVPRSLASLQANVSVPEDAVITASVLNPAAKAAPIHKSRDRGLIAGAAVGLLLTLVFVAAFERFAGRRARRAIVAAETTTDSLLGDQLDSLAEAPKSKDSESAGAPSEQHPRTKKRKRSKPESVMSDTDTLDEDSLEDSSPRALTMPHTGRRGSTDH